MLLEILDGDNTIFSDLKKVDILANKTVQFSSETLINEVKQWSAENPSLYTLKILVTDKTNSNNNQFIKKKYWF